MNSYMEYLESKADVWIQNNSKLNKGKNNENNLSRNTK